MNLQLRENPKEYPRILENLINNMEQIRENKSKRVRKNSVKIRQNPEEFHRICEDPLEFVRL